MLIPVSQTRYVESYRLVELSVIEGTQFSKNDRFMESPPSWWLNEDMFYTFAIVNSNGPNGEEQMRELFLEAFDTKEAAQTHLADIAREANSR